MLICNYDWSYNDSNSLIYKSAGNMLLNLLTELVLNHGTTL